MTNPYEPVGLPVGPMGRFLLLATCALLIAGFAVAASLEPDPRGYGTHQRLGLPECSFRTLFQKPCPGCGLTTSLALLVRTRWREAARSNPAGVLLGMICLAAIPWCGASAWQGRLWWVEDPWPVLAWLLAGWGMVGMSVWMVRLLW